MRHKARVITPVTIAVIAWVIATVVTHGWTTPLGSDDLLVTILAGLATNWAIRDYYHRHLKTAIRAAAERIATARPAMFKEVMGILADGVAAEMRAERAAGDSGTLRR